MPSEERTHRYTLYVKDSSYARPPFETAVALLQDLEKKDKNVKIEVVDAGRLTVAQREKVAAEIRTIPPQTRGRVVSGGGMTLALSGSKNLNLDNTPILVIKDSSDRALAVFPHALEGKVETVLDHLNKAIKEGVDAALYEKRVPTEELITELLSVAPSIIEDGLVVTGREYLTPTGPIDLLLRDSVGTVIVVEVEVTATEQTIGQVCKLAEGYLESVRQRESDGARLHGGLKIRKVIVCIKARGLIHQACKNADVELYQLRAERST